jgi:flagellar FliL protein
MAKAKNSDRADGGQASSKGFLLALAVLTLVGGGAGALFGMQMSETADPAAATGAEESGAAAKQNAKGAAKSAPRKDGTAKGQAASSEDGSTTANGTTLVVLDPIFANLAEPKDVWMRLEAALMVKAEVEQRDVLIAKVSQDLMQFLRTVKLAQLEDASGLQFLRDDLNDIVRSRSDGQVTELLVKGLIVE